VPVPFGMPDERAETVDAACVGPDLFSPRSIAGCGKRLSKELLTTVVHCPALWFHYARVLFFVQDDFFGIRSNVLSEHELNSRRNDKVSER
jgi:hypothetical protein